MKNEFQSAFALSADGNLTFKDKPHLSLNVRQNMLFI